MLGIVLDMRLRVSGKSQASNVHKLMATAPNITDAGHRPNAKFDQGYGKDSFVAHKSIA